MHDGFWAIQGYKEVGGGLVGWMASGDNDKREEF